MKIGLLPFDSKFPNLALMKLSAYHKSKGDQVFLMNSNYMQPDKLYVSVIFPKNRSSSLGVKYLYPDSKVIYGGSAINYDGLPYEIEHLKPDYDIYNINYSMGFVTRGCMRMCDFCIVHDKEGNLSFNAPLKEFVDERFDKLILLDNNLLAYPQHLDILKELRDRNIKVDFNQGLDIRLINKDNAKLFSELRYYNHHFNKRTLRFSYDHSEVTSKLKKGVKLLIDNGVRSDHLFFYILAYPNNIQDAVKRVNLIKEIGARPFIMKINQMKTKELNKLAKWVNHLPYYTKFSFDEFRG